MSTIAALLKFVAIFLLLKGAYFALQVEIFGAAESLIVVLAIVVISDLIKEAGGAFGHNSQKKSAMSRSDDM